MINGNSVNQWSIPTRCLSGQEKNIQIGCETIGIRTNLPNDQVNCCSSVGLQKEWHKETTISNEIGGSIVTKLRETANYTGIVEASQNLNWWIFIRREWYWGFEFRGINGIKLIIPLQL